MAYILSVVYLYILFLALHRVVNNNLIQIISKKKDYAIQLNLGLPCITLFLIDLAIYTLN